MAERRFTDKYDDIIHLQRPVSGKHPPMSMADRAAQFSPFAALTGHGEAVKETARLTGTRVELDEYETEILRGKLQYLSNCVESWNAAGRLADERPAVAITYFVPDLLKEGGEYVTVSGPVKKIDPYLRQIVLMNCGGTLLDGAGADPTAATAIPVDEIVRVESEIFEDGNV